MFVLQDIQNGNDFIFVMTWPEAIMYVPDEHISMAIYVPDGHVSMAMDVPDEPVSMALYVPD